jgi:hypothetical protein
MATLAEVEELIRREDPAADLAGLHEEGERIYGEIRSVLFIPMSQDERHTWISRHIREPLGTNGFNVGILLPLAPMETAW